MGRIFEIDDPDTGIRIRSTTLMQIEYRNGQYRRTGAKLVGNIHSDSPYYSFPTGEHIFHGSAKLLYAFREIPYVAGTYLAALALVLAAIMGGLNALGYLFLSLALFCVALVCYRVWITSNVQVVPPIVSVLVMIISFGWFITSFVRVLIG